MLIIIETELNNIKNENNRKMDAIKPSSHRCSFR